MSSIIDFPSLFTFFVFLVGGYFFLELILKGFDNLEDKTTGSYCTNLRQKLVILQQNPNQLTSIIRFMSCLSCCSFSSLSNTWGMKKQTSSQIVIWYHKNHNFKNGKFYFQSMYLFYLCTLVVSRSLEGSRQHKRTTKTMGTPLRSSSNDEGPSRVWMALLEQHSPPSPVFHNVRRFIDAISPTAPTTRSPL